MYVSYFHPFDQTGVCSATPTAVYLGLRQHAHVRAQMQAGTVAVSPAGITPSALKLHSHANRVGCVRNLLATAH